MTIDDSVDDDDDDDGISTRYTDQVLYRFYCRDESKLASSSEIKKMPK